MGEVGKGISAFKKGVRAGMEEPEPTPAEVTTGPEPPKVLTWSGRMPGRKLLPIP